MFREGVGGRAENNLEDRNNVVVDGDDQLRELNELRRKVELLERESVDRSEVGGSKVEHVLKPAFKVKGIVGKPGAGLSFAALERQVEAAKYEHSEAKITEAVIQAISPTIPLRAFLDNKRELSLKTLMTIIHAHFQEGDTTELFNQLSNEIQHASEDAMTFMLRVMEMKEKILYLSKTSEIKYTFDQVQRLFLKVIENGLASEPIRIKLRGSLNVQANDEALLCKLTNICIEEKDRESKLTKQAKTARARAVEAKEVVEKESDLASLTKLVEKLSVQVRELSAEAGRGKHWRSSVHGCDACRKEKKGSTCRHCYKCGSTAHIARDCTLN